MDTEELRKRFEELRMKYVEEANQYGHENAWVHDIFDDMKELIESECQKRERTIAQECYNQCLAVECGEGQCSEAISTQFPELVTKYK